MSVYPTPHLEKLNATLENEKLPEADRGRVKEAIKIYHKWIQELNSVKASGDDAIREMVELLNKYKLYIEVDLIFNSENDFLYRQKGQLKLDNSILEEFLPLLIRPSIIPEIEHLKVEIGPMNAFSSLYFESVLNGVHSGGGMNVQTKDHDFAICKKLYLKSSHTPDFVESEIRDTYIAYVTAECKTNLDKTMFQEACATAHHVKSAVPGAKYFLICEWLDMTPLSTAPTDIDEVILLRRGKRLSSNVRKKFDTSLKRKECRDEYIKFLTKYQLLPERFQRFVEHIRRLMRNEELVEEDVLERGYF